MTSKDKLDQLTQMVSVLLGYVCDLYHVANETSGMVQALESRIDQLTSYEVQYAAVQMLGRMVELGEMDNINRDAVDTIMCAPGLPVNADKLSQLIGGGARDE